jgi:hypothetical protein
MPEFAHFRIILRNTFVKAHSSRDLQIPADSTLLGASICMAVLECIEDLTNGITKPPEEGSTMCQIIRGSFGFLLTIAASGMNSQMKFWELFERNSKCSHPPTINIWRIYQRVMRIGRLAGWVTKGVFEKFKKINALFVMYDQSK